MPCSIYIITFAIGTPSAICVPQCAPVAQVQRALRISLVLLSQCSISTCSLFFFFRSTNPIPFEGSRKVTQEFFSCCCCCTVPLVVCPITHRAVRLSVGYGKKVGFLCLPPFSIATFHFVWLTSVRDRASSFDFRNIPSTTNLTPFATLSLLRVVIYLQESIRAIPSQPPAQGRRGAACKSYINLFD